MKDPNRRRQHKGEGFRFGFARGAADGGEKNGDLLWKDKSLSLSSSFFSFYASSLCSPKSSFWCTISVVLLCGLLSVATLSAFQIFGVSFRPVLVSTWQQRQFSALNAVADFPAQLADQNHLHSIHHVISFPDELLLFLNLPSSPSPQFPIPSTSLRCLYFPHSYTNSDLTLEPISVDLSDLHFLVRCPLPLHDSRVSLGWDGQLRYYSQQSQQVRRWDFLAYASVLDRHDNATVVFVKGLNLRADRLSDATRFECVFGWQFDRPKYLLTSPAITVAQEIVRCRTPLSVLHRSDDIAAASTIGPVLVSVRTKGRGVKGISPTVAHPVPVDPPPASRRHTMCMCTMVRNQARFLKEWIMYHARIGIQRWFIYDNNSNDLLLETVRWIDKEGFNVSRHVWPWIKTQEAGFAHCALRARGSCEWVGFIDVDEFLFLPSSHDITLHDVLRNHSVNYPWVGELRTACFSFGPSGHKAAPEGGVTVGYTCRVIAPERHKSIVRPEALSPSLMNVVHHFHLREGFRYMNMDRRVMVINHYKYQVWDVFKEKFYRRVATYVADWQDEENVGSKDRAPGLGTRAVEPPDWSTRFCEVNDTGLRKWVLGAFADPDTGLLPWSV